MSKRQLSTIVGGAAALLFLSGIPLATLAFVSQQPSNIGVARTTTTASPFHPVIPNHNNRANTCDPRVGRERSTTALKFMGSDGGILGIGTPELFTILLVGYFILGPSDLYKLTKEIGKFIQNFRTFTTEATASIENNLESQLQLEEIRKAQRELNDAFSFRRSINVEEETDPFEVNAASPRMETPELVTASAAATTATGDAAVAAPKKKIRRRRVKKAQPNVEEEAEAAAAAATGDLDAYSPVATGMDLANDVPDLSMEDEISESERKADEALRRANEELRLEAEAEAYAQRRKERMERLQAAEESAPEAQEAEAARFQAQLSGNWNDQILSKSEEELSPLANIMDRLALLEQEKQAADERLQEEFRLREENEERFYREKRQLLEEAAASVQAEVYATPTLSTTTSDADVKTKKLETRSDDEKVEEKEETLKTTEMVTASGEGDDEKDESSTSKNSNTAMVEKS